MNSLHLYLQSIIFNSLFVFQAGVQTLQERERERDESDVVT